MATTHWYEPAHTMADLSDAARAAGRQSMAEFLLSPQLAKPVLQATHDIRDACEAIVLAEATDTGNLASSFEVHPTAPIVMAGNPRVAFRVENSDPAAAPNEFGNKRTVGRRLMKRASAPWHSKKKPL